VVSFPRISPPKSCCTSPLPMRTTCPAHLILLDLINWTVLGEEHKSLSFSLCSFLHSSVNSSLKSVVNGYRKSRLFWEVKYSARKWNVMEGTDTFWCYKWIS
jgi:hypothetical protein